MNLHYSVPKLPPELIDLILDELRDDKNTRCSLVSRSWTDRSQYNFFARMEVIDTHPRLHF